MRRKEYLKYTLSAYKMWSNKKKVKFTLHSIYNVTVNCLSVSQKTVNCAIINRTDKVIK